LASRVTWARVRSATRGAELLDGLTLGRSSTTTVVAVRCRVAIVLTNAEDAIVKQARFTREEEEEEESLKEDKGKRRGEAGGDGSKKKVPAPTKLFLLFIPTYLAAKVPTDTRPRLRITALDLIRNSIRKKNF